MTYSTVLLAGTYKTYIKRAIMNIDDIIVSPDITANPVPFVYTTIQNTFQASLAEFDADTQPPTLTRECS